MFHVPSPFHTELPGLHAGGRAMEETNEQITNGSSCCATRIAVHQFLEHALTQVLIGAIELHSDLDIDPFYAALEELMRLRPASVRGEPIDEHHH